MSIKPREVEAIKAIVTEAIQNGQADIITKKMVVKAILSRLDLPGDHFDKEQRNTVALTAKEVLDAYDAAEAKKAASPAKAASPTKASSKGQPSKSAVIQSSPPPAAVKAKASKPVISDCEEDESEPAKKTKTHPQKAGKPTASNEAPPPKSKKRKSQDAFRTSEFINSEGDPITASQAGAVNSDTSDEEDKPKKKSKSGSKQDDSKPKPASKKAPARKSAANDNPDEAELKKLKTFMAACEARQMWGKVFPKLGLDDTKSQIRYLRQQLRDLGMTGRMSMEAAKKIGARRALEKEARELGIDIDDDAGSSKEAIAAESADEDKQAGSKRGGRTAARPKRAAALVKQPPKQQFRIDSEDDEEEEEQADDGSESQDSDVTITDNAGDGGSSSDSSSAASTDEDDEVEGSKSKKSKAKAKKAKPAGKSKKSSNTIESSDEDSD